MPVHRRLNHFVLAVVFVLTAQSLSFAGTFASNDAQATAYTEQAPPVVVAPNATLSADTPTAQNYAGGKLTVSLGSAASDEQLGLTRVEVADTATGAISVVGDFVYRGTGSGSEVIGAVDGIKNGANGQQLVVNFSQGFTNGDFQTTSATQNGVEVSLVGWTVFLTRVYLTDGANLGSTIAGFRTPSDSTYPGANPANVRDRSVATNQTFSYTMSQAGDAGAGDTALRLSTVGNCNNGYCIVRGPYVISNSAVALQQGDSVSFKWKAFGGSDAYDVFGYLLNTADGSTVTLLDATGVQANTETPWATSPTVTIANPGTYRFVFIGGTYDASGGQAEGGSLAIDDVTVTAASQISVSTADIEKLTRLVTYSQTGDSPNTSRTVTFTTDRSGVTETFSQSIAVTAVDDLPTVSDVSILYLADGSSPSDSSGTITATDLDAQGSWVYGIQGGTVSGSSVSRSGSFGELTINTSTGAYNYVPLDAAVNSVVADQLYSDTFTVTAQKGSDTVGTSTFLVRVSRAPTVTGISPISGIPAGGTVVTITGSNLGALTSVEFGGAAGTNLTLISATEARITTPARPLGSANVVFKSLGTTFRTLTGGFTYANLVAPGAPRNIAISRTETTLVVSYLAPSSGDAVDSYSIQYTPTGGSSSTVQCQLALTCTISGLTADTEYSVVVRATNAAGTGSASAVTRRTLAVVPVLPSVNTPPAAPVVSGPVTPGSSAGVRTVTIAGVAQEVPVPVTIVPINNSTGLRLTTEVPTNSGDTTTVVAELEAKLSNGEPAQLDANGNFKVQRGLDAEVSGNGFKPGTPAQVWLFSTPTLLGTFTVDGNGGFVGTVPIPVSLASGTHTLQLTGVTTANDVLSLAVGISLTSPPAPNPLLPLGRPVINGDPVVGQTIKCVAPAFDRQVQSYSIYFRVGEQITQVLRGNPAPVPSLVVTSDMVGKEIQCVVTAQALDAVSTVANQTGVVTTSAVTPKLPTTPGAPTAPVTVSKVSIPFTAASARVSISARAVIARLNLTGVKEITVVGYVRKGSTAREQRVLPTARANAVVALLKSRGFTGIIKKASAVGTTGTARDRRAEIRLTR